MLDSCRGLVQNIGQTYVSTRKSESRVRGPIASLNSLVEASPAKPRQLFAAAFRPKGRRTLSQSTLRPILSLTHSSLRAGRAGKPILNSKRHRNSYQSQVASDNVMVALAFKPLITVSPPVTLSLVASPVGT